MGPSQRVATLFVRCVATFLLLQAVSGLVGRLMMSPFLLEGGPVAAQAMALSIWGPVTYGVMGVALLLLNKPLGWLLAKGLDDLPAA